MVNDGEPVSVEGAGKPWVLGEAVEEIRGFMLSLGHLHRERSDVGQVEVDPSLVTTAVGVVEIMAERKGGDVGVSEEQMGEVMGQTIYKMAERIGFGGGDSVRREEVHLDEAEFVMSTTTLAAQALMRCGVITEAEMKDFLSKEKGYYDYPEQGGRRPKRQSSEDS